MKLDLSIHCPKGFTLGELCYHSGQAVMESLGLVRIPDLTTAIEEKGRRYQVEKEFLCGTNCPMVLIGFKDIVEGVEMVFRDMAGAAMEAGGGQANVLASREPLWVALGTSVAVGLARMQESTIYDPQSYFGLTKELTPEAAIWALRQHGIFGEIQKAVQKAFYHSLPVFDPEALKVLQVEEQMDKVMLDMLGTIKVLKKVDPGLFSKFYGLLDKLLANKRMNEDHRKDVLGLLLLVYEYLAEETKRMADPRPVYEEAKKMRDRIMSLGFDLSTYTLTKLAMGA